MKQKANKVFLAPITGLISAFTFLFLFQQYLDRYYYPADPDPVLKFSTKDYLILYLIAFPFIAIIAVLFQLFVTLPIWDYYKIKSRFLGFRLWQLIFTACLIFGVTMAYFSRNPFADMLDFIMKFLSASIIAALYWTINIYTLKLTGKS